MKTSPITVLLLCCIATLQAADPSPATKPRDDATWIRDKGTLIFHEAFEREETGNGAKAIGNGWNSATADRVPHLKQADLDGGVLKITHERAAGHQPHIHHEAGFQDGGVLVRFKLPGLSKGEDLTVGFVDRELKTVHAGHLCYAYIKTNPPGITLNDSKTGEMDLANRKRRDEAVAQTGKTPADLTELYKTKRATVPWKPDNEWHELLLVVEGDEMRATLDGKALVHHRSEGFAHPVKRWVSFLANSTAWVDDVKVWKVK